MEASDSPAKITWKQRLTHRSTWLAIFGGLALGTAIAGAWWKLWVVPEQAIIQKRYESTMDIARLYGLQLTYKRAHGTFANDIYSLLSVEPDAAALKSSLAANVDMNTLTVVGDAKRFKIEVNVLDSDRTPIRVRGPLVPKAPAPEPSSLPAPPPPMINGGAPIGR